METTECYFCKGEATNRKAELALGWDEEKGREIRSREILEICKPCNESEYDGTEEYPALLPLAG